jgi:hypothetical protein
MQLRENETILWQGTPKQGFQLVFEDLLIIPFILIMLTVSIMVITQFHIIGLLFLFMPLYAIYRRYVQDIIGRKNTNYLVTSERVIISKKDKTIILTLNKIKKFSYKDHPFKFIYGSIIFGEEENIFGDYNEKFSLGRKGGMNLERNKLAIEFIKDYKEVYNLIKQKIAETKA